MIDSTLKTAALALSMSLEPVAGEQIVDGTPQTGYVELAPVGDGTDIGVWEMTAGAMSDTEADEVFVVIAGSAEVEFLESGERVVYAVGDIGRLQAGQRTIWRVADRIRKVYVT
ncbi:cupin domain-containing protein [Leifsonia sp. YIM 134122]|uniref:Cupin domain-containing protein n=1 Tax=Leifsonia stereocauli TaxID=3134136 RepID=A0ABU9W6P2_9MICO